MKNYWTHYFVEEIKNKISGINLHIFGYNKQKQKTYS